MIIIHLVGFFSNFNVLNGFLLDNIQPGDTVSINKGSLINKFGRVVETRTSIHTNSPEVIYSDLIFLG